MQQNESVSSIPTSPGRHAAVLFVGGTPENSDIKDHATFRLHLLPNPPGSEEVKTPLLGIYYMLGLRAEFTGHTLLGLRVDQVMSEVGEIAGNPTIDPNNITAEASGHEALVLLYAAVLDPRLRHITLSDLPPSYRDDLANPLPKDIAEDIVPGVLLHFDIPDLVKALGERITVLSVMSTKMTK